MMKSRNQYAPLIAAVVTAFSLASAAPTNRPPETAQPAPPANPALQAGHTVDVVIMVGGRKEVEEREKRVSDQGELVLPLVNSVKVKGLTIQEVRLLLTGLYMEYFVRPEVLVEFTSDGRFAVSPWGFVVVLGHVRNPGRVSMPPTRDLTVTSAIQQAGGLERGAKASAIRLTRTLADGQSSQTDIDIRRIGTQGALTEDPPLQSGDVIFVPQMMF